MKIKDCGEPLTSLKKVCPKLKINIDLENNNNNPRKAYLRKTVAEKLCHAQKLLPDGMTFTIRDAWRSQKTQKEIYQSFLRIFKKRYPKLTKSEIAKKVDEYVAPYNSSKNRNSSGHMTGGAVDLRLWKNGRLIPMKSSKLSYEENAKLWQSKLPKYIQNNRKIMIDVLEKAGFQSCAWEYWHWSYGDWRWAKHQKKTAIYDIVKNVKK